MAGANLTKHQAGKQTSSAGELGMWPIGRLFRLRHGRTVNAFTSPTVWWFRNSATDRRDEAAGFRLQLGVEADDALRKALGMPVSPWWQPQLPALRTLPTRHRTCELRWGRPSLCSYQGRGQVRSAPPRKERSCPCQPRLDTSERYPFREYSKTFSN